MLECRSQNSPKLNSVQWEKKADLAFLYPKSCYRHSATLAGGRTIKGSQAKCVRPKVAQTWHLPLFVSRVNSPSAQPRSHSALKIGVKGTFCARPMLFYTWLF